MMSQHTSFTSSGDGQNILIGSSSEGMCDVSDGFWNTKQQNNLYDKKDYVFRLGDSSKR